MKRYSWKYIAGLIDGEGCLDVQITNGIYVRPRVRIGMADNAKYLLVNMQANFGGYLSSRDSKNDNWQNSTAWELCGYTQVCPFLRNFVNHLELKQEQAKFLLWMENNVKGKQVAEEARQFIRDELKAMKRDPHRLSEKAQEKLILLL
jgi:hypothetical protein